MTQAEKIAAATMLALLLAGGATGEHAEDFYVAPGKYVLYDCQQLAGVAAHFEQRNKELTDLIARAKQGPGGELASSLAYDADYYSNLGELKDVRREQAEKKCAPDIKAAPVAPTPAKGTPPRRKRATP
jgi:hypothetical protein